MLILNEKVTIADLTRNEKIVFWGCKDLPAGVSNPWPVSHAQPMMAVDAAQHEIVNLLKTLFLLISFHWCLYLICGPRQLLFF